jgi:hypothetical protein
MLGEDSLSGPKNINVSPWFDILSDLAELFCVYFALLGSIDGLGRSFCATCFDERIKRAWGAERTGCGTTVIYILLALLV